MGYAIVGIIAFILGIGVAAKQLPQAAQGKFKVSAYKNNELVYTEVYENKFFLVQAGDKYDRIEITEVK